VSDLLRATNGIHTCDSRAEKSSISQNYPSFAFDLAFSEKDEFWDPKIRENEIDKDKRMTKFLEHLFDSDGSTFVGLTSHSGVIAALLRVIGHWEFKPKAGDVFPDLVKGKIIE